MKNIFSRATAHLRLKVSTITAQLRSIYGIPILIFAFLTLGVGQMWAEDSQHWNAVAATNSNNYTFKLNVSRYHEGGCSSWQEWEQETMVKAGITFEGKKLYSHEYWTCNGLYVLKFQMYDGSTFIEEKGYSGSVQYNYYNNYVYNYDAGSYYGQKTMTNGARVYFDATDWSESTIKLVTGHAHHQKYYTLSPITNTNLYYGTNGDTWSDAMGWGIVGGTSRSNGNDQELTDVSANANEYTGWKNWSLENAGTNNAYLCVPNGDAGEEPSMHYNDSHETLLNSTQTVKYALATNGGTPAVMSSGTTPAKITMSSYKFVSGTYNAVSSESPTALSAGGTTYTRDFTAARTATTTLTVSEIVDGYQFDGWYDAANGGTRLSSSTTYTYYPTAATTVYARFSEKTYTVTFASGGNGTVSTPSSPSATVGQVTGIAVNVTPSDGYEFNTWTITSGTGSFASDLTNASNTFYPTSNATITASFRSTATNSLTVSAGTHVNTVSGSQDPVTLGSKYAISATAFETGYEFLNWTAAPAANAEFDNANSASTNVTVKNGSVTVTANAQEVMHDVSITGGTGDSSVGIATKATVTAAAAAAGKKFDHWTISGTYTLQDATTTSSREIHFTATSDVSLSAVYTDRDFVKVYFAKPSGWGNVYAYAWQASSKVGDADPTNRNAAWHGVDISSNTETIKGTTYHYYKYYTDNNGTGEDQSANANWDKIVFNDNGSNKTSDLTIADGHFYHKADGQGENNRNTATVSGSASAEDWYVCGYWNQSTNDWGFAHPINLNGGTSGNATITGLTASRTQEFKIYRASTDQWFKWTGGPSADYIGNYAALIGEPMTLRIYDNGRNTFSSLTTDYVFALDISSTSNPVLTVAPNDMTDYNTTLSINGHGSLDKATGTIRLKQYVPTTITATPETSYRFKQWTVTGGVACSSTTSATATFTATAAGGTITAEFTNDEVIYFDASNIENEWGNDVYVTFLNANFEWNDGDGALIVKNWVDNALHSVRMTRIPNTRIFYLDYSGLSGHDQVKQYVLFTSKSLPNTIYNLYEMAAVTRGDYNKTSGNNMCVAENFREKDKNKTGYYCGYWMNYNDTKAGINLRIYDGSGDITSGNGDFTLSAAGSRTYTATVTLSANTTYRMELQGYNNTYYKNSGTMISTNCSGWSYVDRQATVGHITTTAGGEYTFTLNCADKLYLTADYPLAVGDYRIVYQGKVKDGGSVTSHPSQVIRQLAGGATERKDTVGFYVTGDWSLKLQKCSSIDPEITWEDACTSSTLDKSAFDLDDKTGVYTFPLTLTSTGGSCDQITVGTPIPYTGNYYIRTDVADGGWEAYKRASDNRMIFSEYARDHSGYDYYHCHWTPTNTNVKFTIANDYSACITETFENDSPYVTEYGKLPYQASVRFMYNSATNSIGRAYLNGSSEEGVNTFLWLQGATAGGSEPKIFKGNGSALTNDTIKMQDKNNWIYQLDIKANEKARVKLISNYHFNGYDHLQYFKGTDAVWSDASTAEILGGNYSLHPEVKHDLRIIYDFKTNRLLSAWLVPETGTVASAAINTDVMILKQNQNDARQITFAGSSDELTEVDTVYTAIQLDKDFLTGNVASVYEKQFYWVSFPYRVKLNDVFGSIGNYGADWIMQRYNGKKRAANGFWIDSEPNWEFMDRSETLNPYEGYILTLDLGEFTSGSLKWNNNVTYLTLYFPSDGKVGNIKQTSVSVKYTDQSDYVCTITRDNRNIKDSYWRCIGSPSFATSTKTGWNTHDGSDEQWTTANLPFLYEWNKTTNVLSPITTDGYTFKPLTGYMVQYSGESIEWTSVVTPSVSAPKRQNSAATDLTYKLQLVRGEEEVDHTFVRFSDDENITAAFEFNQDLCKEYKSGGNIYTITSDAIQVAGNSLPLSTTQTTVVPVGVSIKNAGEYTFAIPEGTEGIGVTLVDNETGTRTSLSALDYTVTLQAGDYTGRFVLEISPIQNTPTGLEEPTSDSSLKGRAQKVMIDGILYIVKGGKMFDARGARVE